MTVKRERIKQTSQVSAGLPDGCTVNDFNRPHLHESVPCVCQEGIDVVMSIKVG